MLRDNDLETRKSGSYHLMGNMHMEGTCNGQTQ